MASDVHVARYLMANDAGLLVAVPAARIMAGPLPEGIALPAISIQHLSTLRKNYVAEQAVQWCTSRVQITVAASDYPTQQTVMHLVRAAMPRSRGNVDGVDVDAILSDIEGPEFRDDEAGIYFGTLDYVITYNEAP